MLNNLKPLLLQGRQRAATIARPVLVSLTIPLPEMPTLSLDAAVEAVVWQQPSRDVTLFGIGRASAIEASGGNRFGHVREGLARLLAEAVIKGTPPLALAGFSFDPEQPKEERWQAFPDGLCILPRLLFAHRDGRNTLTANALLEANTDIDVLNSALRRELEGVLSTQPPPPDAEGYVIEDTDARVFWLDNVTDLTQRIGEGEADKVVLARRVEVEAAASFSLDATLARMRQRYPETTIFAVRNGDSCFLGATPETLVRLEGRTVRADCLAGSYRRGATEAEDRALGEALLSDDKERREHAIVAKALSDSLREVCTDLNLPEGPSLRRLTNVQHLHTPIEAIADGPRHVLELVQRVHPTPATAGLPREKSLCLIRRHEPFGRGWYAGPIGWLDASGDGEFAVALRSALVCGSHASLYAGCGIVSGSDPAREYDESAIKLEAMLWALNAKR